MAATNNIGSFEELEKSTKDLPLLGYVVNWRLSNVAIKHAALLTALEQAGFKTFAPSEPTDGAALRRAILDWLKARKSAGRNITTWNDDSDDTYENEGSDDGDENENGDGSKSNNKKAGFKIKRSLLRKINSRKSLWLVYNLVLEDVDLDLLGLFYGTDLRIFLHKEKHYLTVSASASGLPEDEEREQEKNMAQELGQYWTQYQSTHLSGNLSRLVRNIVGSMQTVALRREGGVYFVPASYHDELERLRGLIASFPVVSGKTANNSYLMALPVIDRIGAKKQLAMATHAGFLDEIKAMQMDLLRFVEQSKAGKVKPETVQTRLIEYKQLRKKAKIYSELLGMQQENILVGIEELKGKALQLVEAISDNDDEDDDDENAQDEATTIEVRTSATVNSDKNSGNTFTKEFEEETSLLEEIV